MLEYGTMKLRELEAKHRGGIEGFYREAVAGGMKRRWIAIRLGMSVAALEKWVTVWNKNNKEAQDETGRHGEAGDGQTGIGSLITADRTNEGAEQSGSHADTH